MSQLHQPGHSPLRHSCAAVRLSALVGPLALLSASSPLTAEGVGWHLQANVPVICAILAVETSAEQPTGLAVATNCNAERFQLSVNGPSQPRSARSSAGPVTLNGSAVTITSRRPGYALTTIELADQASTGGPHTVTLQPL